MQINNLIPEHSALEQMLQLYRGWRLPIRNWSMHQLKLKSSQSKSKKSNPKLNTPKQSSSLSRGRYNPSKKRKQTKGPINALVILILLVAMFLAGKQLLYPTKYFGQPALTPVSDAFKSQYIYVLDRTNQTAEFSKNAGEKAFPASLVKIMTTLVALEHIDDLSAIAPVDVATYKAMVEQNASMAGFYGKEQVTYRDLLYGTILSSGGEAANSLAINVSGSVPAFVELMNTKAKALGLTGTHFTSPEGLHDKNQYTTARDMATLLDYALNNGHFQAIFTKKQFHTTATRDHPKGIQLRSTVLSRLNQQEMVDFNILGGKSGTTGEAGQCWATLGQKGDREYIVVVMGAPLNNIANPDRAQVQDTLKLFRQISQ